MIILNENSSIKKLYHISDIHIRRYDKHVEYNHVFNNLYSYLISVTTENDMIVITGDILHAKDNLTPDCVIKTHMFLKTLAKIRPVILIAGNHDCVESNLTIKDSLEAILNESNIENLYYLKKTDSYKYGNIIFGLSSLLDKGFIKAESIEKTNETLIGLYHGPVGKCATAVGVILNGDKQISDFDGYDYVLLGDIHKYQFVAPNIAYSSSLISQNFAELDKYHGVLIWDLENKTTEYNIIDNPYRHMGATLIDNKVIIDEEEININEYIFPSHAKLRLTIHDTNYTIVKKTIKKRYPNIVFYEHFYTDKKEEEHIENDKLDIVELLDSYINKLNETDQKECIQLFSNKLNETNLSEDKMYLQWELLDLEFSNMFAYGENNKLDFTKLPFNEIIGLFAPNSHGKSSLIDIILFSLYENFSRNVYSVHRTIPSYIVNNNKKWFETKIRFKLGSDIYTIHKKGNVVGKFKSKTGKSISFVINEFTKDSNGCIINLTRKDRFETQKEVNNIIGTYDDFCLTTLFLQNKERNFYEMKSTDRKEFLYNLLGLDQFEKMYNHFKNEEKISKVKYDDLKEKLENIDSDFLINKIDELHLLNKKYEKKKNKIIQKKIKYNRKKHRIVEELTTNNYIYDTNLIKDFKNVNDLKKVLECFSTINNIEYGVDERLIKLQYQYPDNNNELVISIGSIINQQNEYENIIKHKEIINKYESYKLDFNLDDINENCLQCIKRKKLLEDQLLEKNKLENELNKIGYDWNKYKLSHIINEYDKNKLLINKYIYHFIIQLSKNNNYKLNVDEYILILKSNINNIESKTLLNKLKQYDNKIIKLDLLLNKYNIEHTTILYDLAISKEKLTNLEIMQKEYNENEHKYNIYSVLKKATHINGIPSKIINTKLSSIEENVNGLISPFIKKSIKIILDSNNILIHILDSEENIINILGGMEMFMINISFKIALANVSILPKNKLLIIDEGVSVLDKEHIEKFDNIAQFLTSNYNNIILISHIDSLKDFITHYININKINGLSCITL
jgi:DNA repair exonuclease SbcCD ATPase subunit